jgi:hypothetical protein
MSNAKFPALQLASLLEHCKMLPLHILDDVDALLNSVAFRALHD